MVIILLSMKISCRFRSRRRVNSLPKRSRNCSHWGCLQRTSKSNWWSASHPQVIGLDGKNPFLRTYLDPYREESTTISSHLPFTHIFNNQHLTRSLQKLPLAKYGFVKSCWLYIQSHTIYTLKQNLSHRIHGTGIFTYIYHTNLPFMDR